MKIYIICPQGLKVGDIIETGKNVEIKLEILELRDIPPGTSLHNVELIPGNGAKHESAGSSVTLSGYDGDYAILKLSSGETRKVSSSCMLQSEQYQILIKKILKLVKLVEIVGGAKDLRQEELQ